VFIVKIVTTFSVISLKVSYNYGFVVVFHAACIPWDSAEWVRGKLDRA